MRGTNVVLLVILMGTLGCQSPGGGGDSRTSSRGGVQETADGLVRTEVDMPGVLYIKEDHAIGSYDAFLVPPVTIHYKRESGQLNDEMEEEIKDLLHESLTEAMQRSGVPIEGQPGQCVMLVGLALYNVDIERRSTADTLGTMTLVMEFRDSQSGQPLLRYAAPNRIENRTGAGNRRRQLRNGFDDMVEELDIGEALVAAELNDRRVRPGCVGRLAEVTDRS